MVPVERGLVLLCSALSRECSYHARWVTFSSYFQWHQWLTVTWSSVVGILKVGWLLPGVMFQGLLTSLLESPTEILFHWLSPCEES